MLSVVGKGGIPDRGAKGAGRWLGDVKEASVGQGWVMAGSGVEGAGRVGMPGGEVSTSCRA